MANGRQSAVEALGFPTTRQQGLQLFGGASTSSSRGGSSIGAWNANSIAPGELPTPPGFLTPEQVVEQAKQVSPVQKTFSAADFLTQPQQLADPKLGSRPFSSVLQTSPVTSPLSVSAFSGVPVPAFLTNAVNQLNQTQSLRASEQSQFRQQLLDAVLSGNFLAAEALRASVVQPGSKVGFGQAVQNPQLGQAAILEGQAKQTAAESLTAPDRQAKQLQSQLNQVQQQLARTQSGFVGGDTRARLTQQQFKIQRELNNLQKAQRPSVSLGF